MSDDKSNPFKPTLRFWIPKKGEQGKIRFLPPSPEDDSVESPPQNPDAILTPGETRNDCPPDGYIVPIRDTDTGLPMPPIRVSIKKYRKLIDLKKDADAQT